MSRKGVKYRPGSSGHVPHHVPKVGASVPAGTKPKGLRCISGSYGDTGGDPNYGKKAKSRPS